MAEGDVTFGLNFSDPVLVEKLNDLQWLDALCAQADRHCQNYVVLLNDKRQVIDVLGIDNDQSFGRKIVDPEMLRHGNNDFFGCFLPNVISRRTAEALLALTPEMLELKLSDLLTSAEIEACQARLAVIQKHIARLEKVDRIIGETPWNIDDKGKGKGKDPFENFMTDVDSSYVARDRKNGGFIKIDYRAVTDGGINKDKGVDGDDNGIGRSDE